MCPIRFPSREYRGRRFVLELVELADVVKECASQDEVHIRAVRRREETHRVGNLEDVLQESATVGVVHRHCGRPHTKPLFTCVQHPVEQRPHERVGYARQERLQLLPHLLDWPRRATHAVFLAEPRVRVAGQHAPDRLNHELQPPLMDLATPLHPYELAGIELVLQLVDIVEDAAEELARGVLQRHRHELAPLPLAHLLP